MKCSLFFFLLLYGCASQIMVGYIDRNIQDVVLDYGPPQNIIDMDDGRRAYQWVFRSGGGAFFSSTTSTGITTGYADLGEQCAYTLFAKEQSEKWVVTGYHPPRLACE